MLGIIGSFGPWELGFILIIILIIVGPGKLPQVGQSIGKAIQNFKKAQNEEEQKELQLVKEAEQQKEAEAPKEE